MSSSILLRLSSTCVVAVALSLTAGVATLMLAHAVTLLAFCALANSVQYQH
jgi:hypothetical protein